MGPPSWQAAPSTWGVLEVGPYKTFAKMKGQYSFFPFSTSSNPGKSNSSTDGLSLEFIVFQLLSHVQLSATPWTAARQASLSFTVSQSLLKFMCIASMMPSNHLILCHPLLLLTPTCPPSGSFLMNQLFASGGQSIGASASASVLPMNIQSSFPLGLTGLISWLSKGLSRVFSSTTV